MNEFLGAALLVGAVFLGGGVVAILENLNRGKLIKLLLSLSGGFLLAIAFIHFIPEIYVHNGDTIGYYILLGFLIQLFLEYFSGGVEHGHIHVKNKPGAIPWMLFISLSIHSFIEGIPLEGQFHNSDLLNDLVNVHSHDHGHQHVSAISGVKGLFLGVILHKIPVAIALMTLLLASGFRKWKAWAILTAFAFMAPLGILFGHFGVAHLLIDMEIILAVVVGMFLHISTTIIFEASENHRFNFVKLISLLVGVVLAIITV
ncbi:MAG: ZIP family metal transporter [Brumimicrobium sp.]|nr:ZIP family metal transporter [Brumimicrobium sp.]